MKKEEKKPPKKLVKVYGVYSEFLGLVFQMFAVIMLGVLLGQFLDRRLLEEGATPWFTVVGSLLSLALAMYLMIRKSFSKPPDKK